MKNKQHKARLMALNPIATSILLSLSSLAYADVVINNGTTTAVNGVPVVNINGANANGISHNIYNKLNVGKEGLVLNNSVNGTNSSLAGQIAGNTNLTTGSAKVILNEVTSKNASSLNGFMEVAGDKASVIIANPNGITCSGCGFINADNVTLTTGKPDVQNGELKGYSVNGGKITIQDLNTDSPTAILARSVVVNGKLKAKEITVVAGNNYVNTNNVVTGSVTATGARSTYSIDVAKLGGMYANQINLISTENGVGVRNQGEFAAATGGIQIDSKGQLVNDLGTMRTTGGINIKTVAALSNVTGKIMADKDINIDTNKAALNNTMAGNISSASNVFISSGALNNTAGRMAASNTLGINTNGNVLTNSGKGKTVGIAGAVVALQTGELNNSNGQIEGYYIGASAKSINNNKGTMDAYGDVDLSSEGRVNNNGGLIRSATGHVKIDATKGTITNTLTKSASGDGADALGIVAGEGGIEINANLITNAGGQMLSAGNLNLNSATSIDNIKGKIVSEQKVAITGKDLNNAQAGLTGSKGITIDLGNGKFANEIGVIVSEDGDVNLNAKQVDTHGGIVNANNITITATDIKNDQSLMVAKGKLKMTATNDIINSNSKGFRDSYGLYLGMPNQEGGLVGKQGVEITARNLNNYSSRLVAENGGPLVIALTGRLDNQYAIMSGGVGSSSIKATSINANYSTIYAAGDLAIETGTLSLLGNGSMERNTAKGIISSDKNLSLNITNNFNNYGWLNGVESLTLNLGGTLSNNNTIYSDKKLNVNTKGAITNYGLIAGIDDAVVTSQGRISNLGRMGSQNTATISAVSIANSGTLSGPNKLTVNGTLTGNGKVNGLTK
ncbi:filamentous hemagglutinin N-terminal domain-containing protein [Utexia brackfieldae]|uniref:two-partner secretion domain-containing protein n=1 Tax=Utexia brackfieldae TaxID=3074108 RepID=UPI00370D092C